MSNYTQTTFFAPKDALLSGNPLKVIYGAAYDVEFGNLATAIATKQDQSAAASFTTLSVSGASTLAAISGTTLTLAPAPGAMAITVNYASGGGFGMNFVATSGNTITLRLGQTGVVNWNISNIGTSGTFVLDNGTSNVLTASAAGSVAILAPTSGVALFIAGAAGSNPLVINGNGNSSYVAIQRSAVASGYIGSGDAIFSGGSTTAFGFTAAAGNSLVLGANNTAFLTISTGGAVIINPPSSGNVLQLGTTGGTNAVLNLLTAGTQFTIAPDSASGANGVTFSTSFTAGGNGPIKLSPGGTLSTTFNAAGGVTVAQPSAGSALTVTGNSGGSGGTAFIVNQSGGVNAVLASFTQTGGAANAVLQLINSGIGQEWDMRMDTSSRFQIFDATNAAIFISCTPAAAVGSRQLDLGFAGGRTNISPGASGELVSTNAALTTGAGASSGTLTNAPAAGNPTKWIKINDNGTIRSVPAW